MTSEPDGIMPDQRKPGVLAARLLIGLIVGLRLHSPREPLPVNVVDVEPRELRLAMAVFAWVIGLGFVFSFVTPSVCLFYLDDVEPDRKVLCYVPVVCIQK